MPQVASVVYQSQAQAFQQFRQEFSNNPSFVSTVSQGDIPDSFQVKLKNAQADYGPVATAVTGKSGVDSVIDDRSILAKFYKLLGGARNAVVIVALILLIAATLLVANTIRLSAFNRCWKPASCAWSERRTSTSRSACSCWRESSPGSWLADLRRPADCREVALAGYATAVLHFQLADSQRGRPRGGCRPRDVRGCAAVRCDVVPHTSPLPARMT